MLEGILEISVSHLVDLKSFPVNVMFGINVAMLRVRLHIAKRERNIGIEQ